MLACKQLCAQSIVSIVSAVVVGVTAALGAPLADLLPRAGLLAAIAIVGIVLSVRTFRWDME